MRIDFAEGANTFVGPNNCGKSNVLRAIALALDATSVCDLSSDRPGPRQLAHPSITLTFAADRTDPADVDALAKAEEFEAIAYDSPASRSSKDVIVLHVEFTPTVGGGSKRTERIVGAGSSRPTRAPNARDLEREAIAALRHAVRFVLISSGESIQSVLAGNFREILHSVVRDRLVDEFEHAERTREEYVDGLTEILLRPLRDQLHVDVHSLFPEIDGIGLTPSVSTIEQTLSDVDVQLEDVVTTPLARKGTGVRGGVLVAMLSYLATNKTRSMIFAVEEPEAFLHPAAQEQLRDQLERVAMASGVTLLVTTHSPFIVTTSPAGKVIELGKDNEGRTRIAQTAWGDADHAPLIGGLLRETTIEMVLAASSAIPPAACAVVLVEGEGDVFCLRLAARLVHRPDLVDDLEIRSTGGTIRMIAQAVLTKAATDEPLVVVTDNDEPGRHVRDTLCGNTFGFSKKQFLDYSKVFKDQKFVNFEVEAEDLFDPNLLDKFVEEHGESVIAGKQRRPDDAWHYDFDQSAKKELLSAWLSQHARAEHVRLWVEMLLLIRQAAGIEGPDESAVDIVASAPSRSETAAIDSALAEDAVALIMNGPHDRARYQQYGALLLPDDVDVEGVTHVGFYQGTIHRELPRVVEVRDRLLMAWETVDDLAKLGDHRVGEFVAEMLDIDEELLGSLRSVVLLTLPGDDDALHLKQDIKNTKTLRGRPVGWTISPKRVPLAALAREPATTDELDDYIDELDAT